MNSDFFTTSFTEETLFLSSSSYYIPLDPSRLALMASYLVRVQRMCPTRFRRKPFLYFMIFIFIIIMFCKGILLLMAPPKLFNVAMATLKENYVIKEDSDDRAECSRRIRNINSYIVHLHDVIINPSAVAKQKRDKNYVNLRKGFFVVPCIGESSLKSSLFYGAASQFQQWASSVKVTTYAKNEDTDVDIVEGYTFAVRRQNIDNSYVRILDMYNAYVTMRMMRQNPKDVNVLFIDAYSEDMADKLWSVVFGEALQLGEITSKQKYEHLVWAIPAGLGPVAAFDLPLPYLDDFRHHVVTSGGAVTSDEVSCHGLRITALTTEDGYSQPEAVSNMVDIIQSLKREFPEHEIMSLIPGYGSMRSQIQMFAKTDILIGVHGNDLTNAVFLHRGSGLIELFPTRFRLISDTRFQHLAEWSNVYYMSWYNRDMLFRDKPIMVVDPRTVISLVNGMKQIICS